MVDRFKRFSFLIFEVSRCWHKLAAEEMTKYGLKGPHAIYLTVLLHNPEGLTSTRLSELCGRDKADVSRAVSLLEEKALVVRQQGNPYRAKLTLTDTGLAAAQQVIRRASLAVELAGKNISDEERETFYYALESITGNLRQLCRDGLPD
jgi:DNA-binding MarR family transcriptional regulator